MRSINNKRIRGNDMQMYQIKNDEIEKIEAEEKTELFATKEKTHFVAMKTLFNLEEDYA